MALFGGCCLVKAAVSFPVFTDRQFFFPLSAKFGFIYSISGQTPEEMVKEYHELTNYTEPHATNLMAQAHDAVWAMALALNATESLLIETGTWLNF